MTQADFLVIGSGVAGLRAALEFGRAGRVLMVTKGRPFESSSIYAQGGVAVALSEEDDVAVHLRDTVKAGHGLCRKDAVRVLVEEGPARIHELIRWGAQFDKAGSQFAFAREAAHSRSRILRARGDAPIYAAVLEELRERDRRDADRAVAPMRIASDAWVLDTTDLDAQAAFAAARDHIAAGLAGAGRPVD